MENSVVADGRTTWPLDAVGVALGGAALGSAAVWAAWQRSPGMAFALVLAMPVLMALCLIDLREHRLPNRLNAALAVLVVVGVVAAFAAADHIHADGDNPTLRAVVGALAMGGFYFVLAMVGRGTGMGLGDVKLAPSLGALLAWASWEHWTRGVLVTFIAGGVWGLVLICRGKGAQARMAFGPFMIGGALLALMT